MKSKQLKTQYLKLPKRIRQIWHLSTVLWLNKQGNLKKFKNWINEDLEINFYKYSFEDFRQTYNFLQN